MYQLCWRKAVALLDDRERRLDTGSCTLPTDPAAFFGSPAWEVPGAAPHRAALNEAKGLLDDLDNTAWDSYAQLANYAEYVRRDLRKVYQVELATIAWAKMYELIVRFDLLPESAALGVGMACTRAPETARAAARVHSGCGGGAAGWQRGSGGSATAPPTPTATATPKPSAVTVHLCEAPGGFVAAVNHYLRTHRSGWHWDWLAVSLNPYYGGNDQFAMVDDDAFMRATLRHWCFGADDSGDVRRPDNIRAIWETARRRFSAAGVAGALLVTADGAIDTSMVPEAQELVNASLHYAEVVAALGLLAEGGSFLWKGFTLFEHTSLGLLHLVGCLFDKVTVCKPCTSKACNSEVYVVCQGFRGVQAPVLEVLLKKCGEDVFLDGAMLPRSAMPEPFLDSVLGAAQHFSACTASSIRDALDKSGLPPSGPTANAIRRVKEHFAAEWFLRMQMLRLDRRLFVAPGESIDGSNNSTSNVLGRRRELLGTLQERQEQYRRRRNDLGLDGGAIAAAAALQGQLSTSAGSAQGLGSGLSSSHGYYRGPVRFGLGHRQGHGGGCGSAGDLAGLGADVRSREDRSLSRGQEGVRDSTAAATTGNSGNSSGSATGGSGLSATIAKLMAKMGYKEGAGLGRDGLGVVEPLQAVGNTGRAGLGLGSSAEVHGFFTGIGGGGAGLGAAGLGYRDPGLGVTGLGDTGLGGVGLGGAGLGVSRFVSGGFQLDCSGRHADDDGTAAAAAAPTAAAAAAVDTSTVPSSGAAIPPSCWAAAPDTSPLYNYSPPLAAAEVAVWSAEAAAGVGSVASVEGGPAGSVHLGMQVPPTKLTKSKLIIDDRVLVALRRAREEYSSPSASSPEGVAVASKGALGVRHAGTNAGVATGGLGEWEQEHSLPVSKPARRCRHVPPICVAPRRGGVGSAGRSYWKLAALDAALSVVQHAAASAAGAGAAPRALDLSMHGLGATDYLLRWTGGTAAARRPSPKRNRQRRALRRNSESCNELSIDEDIGASSDGGNAAAPKPPALCNLVLGDLCSLRRARCGWPPSSAGDMEGEYDTLYRRQLLWEAATALSVLAPGGCAVLRLGDCLTMFSASVLYVLHRSFERLALVKPFASCACSPERFVVAVGRLEDGGVAASQLLAGLAAVMEVEVAAAAAPAQAPAGVAFEKLEPPATAAPACTDRERTGGCTAAADQPGGTQSPPRHTAAMRVALRPMAITGVVPLSCCVSGDFYVYLAARTQELARRQTRACEAAMADTDGDSQPASAIEERQRLVVEQAEAALAGGLAGGKALDSE
ncbi:hypothetical protein GPECTOR_69g401 [Gonium pectorale]|uniref:Cap-specific mRNA (nucleoside-2'-O-)-methyltransferase 2 n=1 Tax=Gonium pectorale TaxID=33097 RepID=A0A150G387_GONPE|nr:hypothetical protein GPECTOR_69g401 [Gonium pectorale]|eukprot:KXZ44308.1 hypothetical protein GPECTOR_69g401 [Gonium pectorale]